MTTADKSRKITCGRCGREVEMTPDRRITGRDRNGIARDFCCRRCLDEWKEETARCACCGKQYTREYRGELPDYRLVFCSEECEKKYRETARR